MAQLIFDWLNEDVKLSRRIYNLAEDFRDGYLLGELLARYNQQANFNHFSSKGNPDAKINNFCLIEQTMRQIGVPFNSKIAADIMNSREGAVKNLLYELKTSLEAITRNSQQSMNGSYSNGNILCVIAPSRPLYDKTMALTFENAIRAMIENPNEVMMESVTKRFREKKTEFRQSISAGHTGMLESIHNDLYRSKEIERHRKDHEGEFAEAWENINVEQWKTNQRVARERRNLKKRVEFTLTAKRETQRNTQMSKTREHTFNSIDEFDNRLEATILSSSSSAPAATIKNGVSTSTNSLIKTIKPSLGTGGGPELVYIDQNVLREGLVGAQKKMKEHHEDGVVRQQANDRRRRRFIREFDTNQSKMSLGFFEKDVTAQLLNNSQGELDEIHVKDRAISYKRIIADNRENRLQLISQRLETDRERVRQFHIVEAQREIEWVVQADIASQMSRRQALLDASSSASRTQNDDTVRSIVEKIVDVAEWVIACRSLGMYHYKNSDGSDSAIPSIESSDRDVIPEIILRDAAVMFTSPLVVAESLPPPQHIDVTLSLKPFCIADRPLCSDPIWLFGQTFNSTNILKEKDGNDIGIAAYLSGQDTSDFIRNLNLVECGSVVSEVPVKETGDSSDDKPELDPAGPDLMLTPTWLLNSSSEHILGETVIAIRCAVNPVPDEPAPLVTTSHIPLRAAICGLSDLARRLLAEELQKKIQGLQVICTERLVKQALSKNLVDDKEEVVIESPTDNVVDNEQQLQQELTVDDDEVVENPENTVRVEVQASDNPENTEQSDTPLLPASIASLPTPAIGNVDEDEVQRRADVSRQSKLEYKSLCVSVQSCLTSGAPISDELYVSLIVYAIKDIPDINNGFIIQDFPNTKRQALLLMEALSGIRYDLKKPQASDYKSIYAPQKPCEEILYDIKKCGLDVIVYIDSSRGNKSALDVALDERVRARRNLFTGNIEYIDDDCRDVSGKQEVFDSSRPIHTSGLDLSVAHDTNCELHELFTRFQILDTLQAGSYNSLEEAVQDKASQLCERFIPPENLHPDYLLGIAPIVEAVVENDDEDEEENEQVVSVDDLASASAVNSLALDENHSATAIDTDATDAGIVDIVPVKPRAPPLHVINAIPRKLAVCLSDMWDLCEKQSQSKLSEYFTAFRDVRYQFLQRRRCAVDSVNYMLVRLDRRQELFDAFHKSFNEIDADMRFDPDCAAELHLQSLELGDAIYRESELRKKAALDYVKQVAADAVLALAVHRCYCESATAAQSEYNRFYGAMHLLFDYFKAVKGFEAQTRVVNEMELTLPVALPSLDTLLASTVGGKKDAKGKEKEVKKGGKDTGKAAPVPFREPVPAILLPISSMNSVPEPKPLVEAPPDPKAKKPKDKKGGQDENTVANPFAEIDVLIKDDVTAKWTKGVFAVNRDVYEGDEQVCAALEHAVWFEAEKLLQSVSRIKDNLSQQVQWLEATESNLMSVLSDMIMVRFHKEVGATKRLLSMIADAIESADPIEDLWLIAPDAIPPVNPKAVWKTFHDSIPVHRRGKDSESATQGFDPESVLQTVHDIEISESQQPNNPNFVTPEHTEYAQQQSNIRNNDLLVRPASAKHAGKLDITESTSGGSSNSSSDTNHKRPSSSSTAAHRSNEQEADQLFKESMEEYQRERTAIENQLRAKRSQREEDFLDMGMSPSSSKLAAYNELLLEEQHRMDDFDAQHKPRLSNTAQGQQQNMARYDNLARRRKRITRTGI